MHFYFPSSENIKKETATLSTQSDKQEKKTSPHPYYPQRGLPMHIYRDAPKWDKLPGQLLGGTTRIMFIHSSLIRLCLIFTLPLKNICFAVQIPRKLDICMKTKNIILSDKNDNSISDRQVRDCPDVSEKQFHREYPEGTEKISKDYRRDTIYMKGWSLMCPSKNFEGYVKGIIQRSKPTRD